MPRLLPYFESDKYNGSSQATSVVPRSGVISLHHTSALFCSLATHSSSVKQCLWDCGHDISIILFRKICLDFLHPLTAQYLHTSVHHLIQVKD